MNQLEWIDRLALVTATTIICTILLPSCQPKFEVYAPEKEIYVVHCTLDPHQDTQYVKITRTFRSDGDALQYLRENDLSVKGLSVKISGGEKTYYANQVEGTVTGSDPDENRHYTYYSFNTTEEDTLVPGQRYFLSITDPGRPEFKITANTVIPYEPTIIYPPCPSQCKWCFQATLNRIKPRCYYTLQAHSGAGLRNQVPVDL